jgi:CheY-like chemotaxis protein
MHRSGGSAGGRSGVEREEIGPATSSAGPGGARSAMVVSDDADVRLLLRGVLRLLHHRVVREGGDLEEATRSAPTDESTILVFAPPASGEDRWMAPLAGLLRERPEMKGLVLLTAAQEPLRGPTIEAGAQATLLRPFTLAEFSAALRELGRAPEASGATGSALAADSPLGPPSGAA